MEPPQDVGLNVIRVQLLLQHPCWEQGDVGYMILEIIHVS